MDFYYKYIDIHFEIYIEQYIINTKNLTLVGESHFTNHTQIHLCALEFCSLIFDCTKFVSNITLVGNHVLLIHKILILEIDSES